MSQPEPDALAVAVDAIAGHLEKERTFSGHREVSLRLVDTRVDGPMRVSGTVSGTVDGVQADFEVSATAHLKCVRCLVEWDTEITAEGSQHFSKEPDEDGYAIHDGHVDVGGPAKDELALNLPAAPLHDPECKGLCPICGTDLNSDPCDGHGDDSDSPFAVLKDLFDS